MALRSYILKRTIYSIILLFFVITLNFFIFTLLPGDPADFLAAPGRLINEQQINQVLTLYGLEPGTPIWVRYTRYVQNMLTWNFGYSLHGAGTVRIEILERLPNTLVLVGLSVVLSIIVGTFLGVIAAAKRGGKFDTVSILTSLTTFSLPTFWMGIMLLIVFFYYLQWFPGGGPYPLEWTAPGAWPKDFLTEFLGRLRHMFLPVLTLTLFQYGGFLLLTRASMLEVLSEDYVVTARAKGLPQRTVLFKHALKNASLPLITNAAIALGFVLSGAIITETVFSWPGLGKWTFDSIIFNDPPALQAIFYIVALCVIVATFISDIILGVVDPRIRYG